MKIMSHIRSATSMSCVENSTVVPRRFKSSTASLSVSIFTGSSPLNGSSRISSFGSAITAAMNCTFCDIPFDSVSTRLSAQSESSIRASQSSMAGRESRRPLSAA